MEEKVVENKKESEEITLKEFILRFITWYRYLLTKWAVILIFGILGGVIGFIYAWYNKPVYTATTTFVLEESDKGASGLGQYAGLASMAGIDLGGGGGGGIFQGDNILELYKSRTMIEKTLLTEIEYAGKKELLVDRYIDFNKLRVKWAKIPDLKNIRFVSFRERDAMAATKPLSRLQDSILGTIVGDISKTYLSVEKPDKKLGLIKTQVKSTDEFFAKNFNEQIVKNVNDFYIQTKTKKSLKNLVILQHKTDSVRAVMNGAIYTASAVNDATPNLNITRQVQRTAPIQRSQFNAETNKAVLAQLVQNLELSKLSLLKETPLIQVIDHPIFPLEKHKVGKAKSIIAGGFLAGFLTVLFLLIRRTLKAVMA